MFIKRVKRKSQNQAALLARQLAKIRELEVDEGLLVRTTDTLPQVETASRSQRREKCKEVFELYETCREYRPC